VKTVKNTTLDPDPGMPKMQVQCGYGSRSETLQDTKHFLLDESDLENQKDEMSCYTVYLLYLPGR